MSELQLTNQIIEFLNYQGIGYFWRVNSGMLKAESKGKTRMIRMAKAGTSDIQGILRPNGRMVCLEVKLPNKRKNVTSLQTEYLAKMKQYGAITGLVTSPEEAKEFCTKKI